VDPTLTAAISVTAVLELTVVTGLPPAVIARMVDVVAGTDLTVTGSGVETLIPPEIPVIVAVADAGVADGLAVSVSLLVPVVDAGKKVPVTPAGSPATARLTMPLNPFRGLMEIVDLSDAPGSRPTAPGAATMANVDGLIVKASAVDALSEPDVPVMLTVAGPGVAVPLAVSVSILLPVAGFGVKDAVTPLGSPDAAKVTPPVNPY
jgi:hypothetical protein